MLCSSRALRVASIASRRAASGSFACAIGALL